MGDVRIPYYVVRKGRHGYWLPSPKMRAMGFQPVACGHDGPAAWTVAHEWNARWQRSRKGDEPSLRKVYPRGSIGSAFERYRHTNAWKEKPPRTREDWDRGWKYIEPYFGDQSPSAIGFEHLDRWYSGIKKTKGISESARAMKTWRSLWGVMASMQLCVRGADPSAAIRRTTPKGRTATWSEGEAVRHVKAAWRAGYRGLACIVAIAWDTGFSPVDARSLTPSQVCSVGNTWGFFIERGKTGESALGTLSRRTRKLIESYVGALGFELLPEAPIFRTRGHAPGPKGGRPRAGAPYTKDSLGDDFADVRELVFGKIEKRQLLDMRRSGAVEAHAGGATAEGMAAKLANSIDQNKALWKVYLPVDPATIRTVDDARRLGREKLRGEQTGTKKLKLGDLKS